MKLADRTKGAASAGGRSARLGGRLGQRWGTLLGVGFMVLGASGCSGQARPATPPKTVELTADPPAEGATRADRTKTQMVRALANLKAQRWEDARKQLLQVLQDKPRDAQAAYYLGVAAEGAADLPAARRAYADALSWDPSAAEAAANLGALLLGDPGEPAEAIAVMRRRLGAWLGE